MGESFELLETYKGNEDYIPFKEYFDLPNALFHTYYMNQAKRESLKSPDPSSKIGAIIVDRRQLLIDYKREGVHQSLTTPNREALAEELADEIDAHAFIVGKGCNTLPRGIAHTEPRLFVRETKYKIIVHAEVNAILNMYQESNYEFKHSADTLYLYGVPMCASCAGPVINAKIKRVYARVGEGYEERAKSWDPTLTLELFDEVGVEYWQYSDDTKSYVLLNNPKKEETFDGTATTT